jgi:hypothetical protein
MRDCFRILAPRIGALAPTVLLGGLLTAVANGPVPPDEKHDGPVRN